MSYVANTMGDNERVIFRARFHWSYTMTALLWLLILGVIAVGIWMFLSMMIKKWTTEIVVTNERFVLKTGWISIKTQEVSLQKIEEVKLHQSILGRLLGYGSLHIQGTGVGSIEVPNIKQPLAFRRQITNARENIRGED